MIKGMGGAMDLVAGVKKVVVIMDHVTRKGESKTDSRMHIALDWIALH